MRLQKRAILARIVGGFGPHEGLRMMVGGFDIATNGVFEFAGSAMAAPANLLFGQSREPALHQIEPGSAGGREVHVKARMADQSAMNQSVLCVA
jgi:hypothetical protein